MRGGARVRADVLLVERGFFDSRARAREAIEAGLVASGGAAIRKPAEMVAADAPLAAASPHPFVSRGGVKLAHALDAFGIDPAGQICLDVGSSTGGFTDVLLRRGAARVHAVDVGTGQLHPSLRNDPRVVLREGTDIRRLDREALSNPIGVATVDVSFISLRLVLPELKGILGKGAQLVALIKPQFEAGPLHVGRGGIVRDPEVREEVTAGLAAFAGALGFELVGSTPSPVTGRDGNHESLLGLRLA